MKIKTMFLISCFLMFASINLFAGNPGKKAMNCLSVSSNSEKFDNLVFKNRCTYRIFVAWCGDLKYTKKRCGEGPRNTFYTQSANIAPNSKKTTTIKRGGSYAYAACRGSISFGSNGIKHPTSKRGQFACTRT